MLPASAVAPASTGNITAAAGRISNKPWTYMEGIKIDLLIHLASSPAKKRTAAPTSQPVPSVLSMLRFFLASRASSVMPGAYIIGV